MKIDDVVLVGSPLVLASAEEVNALESRLWIKFPSGYHDYMQRLGQGFLGNFIRIYPPWRIEKELVEWRRRIQRYWFWDETLELLPKERALECVVIGDTVSGDELIFHPGRSDRLLVLPRDAEGALEVGSDLLEAITWMCSSGQLVEPFPYREFEPFNGRNTPSEGTERAPGTLVDPEGESLDDIMELGRRWVERHAARETFSDELKSRAGKGTTAKLTFEAIVLTGDVCCWDGYRARYSIFDDQSGNKLGEFSIGNTGDSTSCSYMECEESVAERSEEEPTSTV